MQYASQYFTCTPVMCSDVFMYSVYSHYFTSIFLSCACLLMCARLTHYFTRKARTHTCKRALAALRRTQRRCNCGSGVSDCFLLPSHSHLRLYGASGPNQLVCVPVTPQARAALFCSYGCAFQGQEEIFCFYGSCSYTGPATCISCEAGKFSTASSPRCSTVCSHSVHVSGILLPRMYDVAAAWTVMYGLCYAAGLAEHAGSELKAENTAGREPDSLIHVTRLG